MPLPSRPANLLLAVALLGAAGMAVAAPQQHRRGDRWPAVQGAQDGRAPRNEGAQRPD